MIRFNLIFPPPNVRRVVEHPKGEYVMGADAERCEERMWELADAICDFKEERIDREKLFERYECTKPTVGGRH